MLDIFNTNQIYAKLSQHEGDEDDFEEEQLKDTVFDKILTVCSSVAILLFIFSCFVYFRLFNLTSVWHSIHPAKSTSSSSDAIEAPMDTTFTDHPLEPEMQLALNTKALQLSVLTDKRRNAFVTLAYDEKDFIRSLVLARGIQRVGTNFTTVIFVHPDGDFKKWLPPYADVIPAVNAEVGHFPEHIPENMKKPPFALHKKRWGKAWIKLGFFSLYKDFKKLVYLDSDTYVADSIDDMFLIRSSAFTFGQELHHTSQLTYINSGVCVIVPSEKAEAEIEHLVETEKFPEGDQQVYKRLFLDLNILPYTLLAPTYNLNDALCKHAKYVRVYHLYHHKPWRLNQNDIEPCAQKVVTSWQERQDEVLKLVHGAGINTTDLHLRCCR